MVVIVDDEDRENEGDLTIAAEFVTPAAINVMARLARGLVCVSMTGERLDELGIPQMVPANTSHFDTPFAVSVEARTGVTSGISAPDRARTVQALIDPSIGAAEIVMPGHMFPLRARSGGVFERRGQTEAVVDLCRLAGLYPAGVLTEVMAPDGTMARLPRLRRLARRLGLTIISVEQIRAYRMQRERLIERVTETTIPSPYGCWRAIAYRSLLDDDEHTAFVLGDISGYHPTLVKAHRHDLFEDVFRSSRSEGSLHAAMRQIEDAGRGVILYTLPARSGEAKAIAAAALGPAQTQILDDLGVDAVTFMGGTAPVFEAGEEMPCR